jgi:uncharacterized membrane protein YbhN (UPF0104 family)
VRRTRGAFLARVAISLGLLVLLVLLVDRGELGRRLAEVDARLVLVIVLLVTADRLLMAWKWWLLLRGRVAAVSLWAAVRAYYVASFAGWFLPMTVGADVLRVATLAGGGRTAGLVASVVLERTVGALAQALLAAVAVLTLIALGLDVTLGLHATVALAGILVAAFVAFPLTFPVATWLARALRPDTSWRAKLASLAASYGAYAGARGLVAVFFGLTLLEGWFPVAIHYVAGRALGLDPGFALYLATVPIVFLVARLPISLGGLGIVESSFVYLASRLGLTGTEAFSIALLSEGLVILALVPGAVAYLFPPPEREHAAARRPSAGG